MADQQEKIDLKILLEGLKLVAWGYFERSGAILGLLHHRQ
jgi:hypothetical protein